MTYSSIKEFHEIASSPRKQMDKYLADGKKIVLTVPYYTPDELYTLWGLFQWELGALIWSLTERRNTFLHSCAQSFRQS